MDTQGLIQKLGQQLILAKKATFLEKGGTKKFTTPYSISFLSDLHHNEAFFTFFFFFRKCIIFTKMDSAQLPDVYTV